jgi:4-hydroxymandelate oxidase
MVMRKVVNINDLAALAHGSLPTEAWDYLAGGAEDEHTVAENRRAFRRIKLRPRVLTDVSRLELSTTVLGQPIAFPVLLGPTSPQRLFHPEAELATARAAASAGTIAVCSTDSHFSIEEVAAVASPPWFQLYCYHSRATTERLIRRVEDAGCRALVVTVDASYPPRRERTLRSSFRIPPEIRMGNLEGLGLPHANLRDAERLPLTWDDLAWIVSLTTLPIILKGILDAEDAALAIDHGVQAIIVSNHGGRQLDGARASIDVLPEIADRVAGRVELMLDGGIRRGTDVVKSLGRGARAVLLGRSYLWGLAVEGEAGIRRVLGMLREEIVCCMKQLGCGSLQLCKDFVIGPGSR